MQTQKHNNRQRAPTEVPKTRQHCQRSDKTVLGCQKTNGINPRSAIRQKHTEVPQLIQALSFFVLKFQRYPHFINYILCIKFNKN